ncbi:MAG: omptin family outer membrane protease [Pseudomonadota bacterium]
MVSRVAAATCTLLIWVTAASAQMETRGGPFGIATLPVVSEGLMTSPGALGPGAGASCSMNMRKYLNSFTSYEFPNPYAPNQDPLSRLEFPIDQWFAGLTAAYKASWWTLEASGWMNVNRDSKAAMQDSDWDDELDPSQKTIFSESKSRLDKGFLCDVGLSIVTPLSGPTFSIRPVLGMRHQYFAFTTYDGTQYDIEGATDELPGDGIQFKQTFLHYYAGAAVGAVLNFGGSYTALPPLYVSLQGDYAKVSGRNEDLHLLRLGNRTTTENTEGYCWHIGCKAESGRFGSTRLGLLADFTRISTKGTHELQNGDFGIQLSFDGARVWSDQASLSGYAEFRF